jgi:hypothetical protein
MTNDTDTRDFWRSELGDASEPLWYAFKMAKPPALGALEHERRQQPWIWFGLAASWLGIATLAAWNVGLQNDVTEAREQAALVSLAAGRSDRVLWGLAHARQLDRDPAITAALVHLLKTSVDPNVQLEALDLLLDDGLQDSAFRREVVEEIRFNRAFIELALQAQETRT